MTYDAYETSAESGNPVELYEFAVTGDVYRYTSSKLEIDRDGVTYLPRMLERDEIVAAADDQEDRIEIELPTNDAFAQRFVRVPPGSRSSLTIRRTHRDDPDEEIRLLFKGLVHTPSYSEDGRKVTFVVLPITSAYSKEIPRYTYQNLCNHVLGDARCKKSLVSFTHSLTCTAVSGNVYTLSGAGALGSDYFEMGTLEFAGETQLVIAQGGVGNNDVTLLLPFSTTPLGSAVIAETGCKHRLSQDCNTKFANAINFGGWESVPKDNIFETGV